MPLCCSWSSKRRSSSGNHQTGERPETRQKSKSGRKEREREREKKKKKNVRLRMNISSVTRAQRINKAIFSGMNREKAVGE